MTYDSTKETPIFEKYVEEQKVEEVSFHHVIYKLFFWKESRNFQCNFQPKFNGISKKGKRSNSFTFHECKKLFIFKLKTEIKFYRSGEQEAESG